MPTRFHARGKAEVDEAFAFARAAAYPAPRKPSGTSLA